MRHNADTLTRLIRDNPVVLTCKSWHMAIGAQFSLVVFMSGQADTITTNENPAPTPAGPSGSVSAPFRAALHLPLRLVV